MKKKLSERVAEETNPRVQERLALFPPEVRDTVCSLVDYYKDEIALDIKRRMPFAMQEMAMLTVLYTITDFLETVIRLQREDRAAEGES